MTGSMQSRNTIENQEEHHQKRSFAEEFESILKEAGYTDQEIEALLRT